MPERARVFAANTSGNSGPAPLHSRTGGIIPFGYTGQYSLQNFNKQFLGRRMSFSMPTYGCPQWGCSPTHAIRSENGGPQDLRKADLPEAFP